MFAALALVVGACGAEEGVLPELTEPVGKPLLPDLSPEPPVDLRIQYEEDGRTTIRFSSTLANVGDGDFTLRATRDDGGEWLVLQEIQYSEVGAELVPTEATMAWGGDGHDHWHIERVATYTLYRLDENGEIIEDDIALPDHKVGFCFYDHTRVLDNGPEEGVYSVHSCGHEDDEAIRMGMSAGWSDVYNFALPGQSIDIGDLEDGDYRVIAEADPSGWFTEASLESNSTWLDFALVTIGENRFAIPGDMGPFPAEH